MINTMFQDRRVEPFGCCRSFLRLTVMDTRYDRLLERGWFQASVRTSWRSWVELLPRLRSYISVTGNYISKLSCAQYDTGNPISMLRRRKRPSLVIAAFSADRRFNVSHFEAPGHLGEILQFTLHYWWLKNYSKGGVYARSVKLPSENTIWPRTVCQQILQLRLENKTYLRGVSVVLWGHENDYYTRQRTKVLMFCSLWCRCR